MKRNRIAYRSRFYRTFCRIDLTRIVCIVRYPVKPEIRRHSFPVKRPARAIENHRSHRRTIQPPIVFSQPLHIAVESIRISQQIMGQTVWLSRHAVCIIGNQSPFVFLCQPEQGCLHIIHRRRKIYQLFSCFGKGYRTQHILTGTARMKHGDFLAAAGLYQKRLKGDYQLWSLRSRLCSVF